MVVSTVPSQLSPGAACREAPGESETGTLCDMALRALSSRCQSCSSAAETRSGPCSCHPTYFGLASCSWMSGISAWRSHLLCGSMMGGKDFVVQHLNWSNPADSVICRWEAPEGGTLGPRPPGGLGGAPGPRAGATGPMGSLGGGWEPRERVRPPAQPVHPLCPSQL